MNLKDLHTTADVIRWLSGHVEWNDIASDDMATRAVEILRQETSTRSFRVEGCTCLSIQDLDKTRHFKGCPIREQYPRALEPEARLVAAVRNLVSHRYIGTVLSEASILLRSLEVEHSKLLELRDAASAVYGEDKVKP